MKITARSAPGTLPASAIDKHRAFLVANLGDVAEMISEALNGDPYALKENAEKTLEWVSMTIAFWKEDGDRQGELEAHVHAAELNRTLGKNTEAMSALQNALSIYLSDPTDLIHTWDLISNEMEDLIKQINAVRKEQVRA